MLNRKKWLAAWVALLVMLAQLSVAFAGEDGTMPYHRILKEGGETTYSTSIAWHNPPLVDEETNAMLASLLGLLQVSGMTGTAEDGAKYGSAAVSFGDAAIPFEWYSMEDGLYANSPLIGGAVGIVKDDLPNLLSNIGEAFKTTMQNEQFDQAFQTISDFLIQIAEGEPIGFGGQMAQAEIILDAAALEELAAALAEWGGRAFAADYYEGEIISKLGVTTSRANVYALTKAELLELLHTVLPMIIENEAFLKAIFSTASMYGYGSIDTESFWAAMENAGQELDAWLASLEALIPDDMRLQYIECLGDDGGVVLCELEIYIPDGDEDMYIGYIEWIPGTASVYLFIGDEQDGIMALTSAGTAEATTSEGAYTVENTFTIEISVIGGLETQGTIDISVSEATTEQPGEMAKEIALSVILTDAFTEETNGFMLSAREENAWEDEGPVSMYGAVNLNAILSGEEVPILTIETAGEAGGNEGPSFDPASFDGAITRLGQLDQAQYLEWSQNVLLPGITQSMFLLLSALPPELVQEVGAGFSAFGF